MLAYIAGLIDGEGCVNIAGSRANERRYYSLHLTISNTSPQIMTWLEDQVGGWVYAQNRSDGKSKIGYGWNLGGRNGAKLLEAVLPYMVIKRDQARLALEFVGTFLPNSGRRSTFTREIEDRRAGLKQQMHVLNKKGVA